MAEPITQENGAGHETTERSVLAATFIGLDHVPAGPVVVVVLGTAAVVVLAPDDDDDDGFGLWLHPATRNESANAANAASTAAVGAAAFARPAFDLVTTTERGGRSLRGRGGGTTYRGR